jgi:uroporphyrinogen decarboxylase
MRQAGRYMPQFRAVRAKHDFLTVCKTPELATEVTLQPLNPEYGVGVDAAIIFSDILIPLEGMGMAVRFDDKGPHLDNPLRDPAAVDRLVVPHAAETAHYVGKALAMVKQELAGKAPLIGFAGAPWTLAAYMIEGGGSKNYSHIKGFMYNHPEAFHRLMDKVADTVIDHMVFQLESGADVVQLFESWGGVLSPQDFRTYALPYTRKIVSAVKAATGKPFIVYMNGCGHVLEDLADTGADAVGIDWRIDLAEAFDRVGDRVALQGNMDPCMLYAPIPQIQAEVRRLAAQVAGRPGHIFNLGHGILPDVPVEHARAFVDAVKALEHAKV